MATSYLDKTGLAHLWEKIKSIIPTKTSDLTNDSGYITSSSLPSGSTTAPLMDGTATVGTSINYARADHIHPSDTTKVDKNQGSTNADKYLGTNANGVVTLRDGLRVTDDGNGTVTIVDGVNLIAVVETYQATLSIANNIITLSGSDGATSSIALPVFGGTSADIWEGGEY